MKKQIIYSLLALTTVCLGACNNNDEIDTANSIFSTEPLERNAFDYWLLDNYTYPYNIDLGGDMSLVMLWKHGRFRVEEFDTGERFRIPAEEEIRREVVFVVPRQLAGTDFDAGFALRREGYTNWFNGKPLRTEVAR